MTTNMLKIPTPDDFHVHLRGENDLMSHVLHFTASVFGRALVMPNTEPKVEVAKQALDYGRVIRAQAAADGNSRFQPLMTIYLTAKTTPQMIREAHEEGVIAAKFYPEGATTNSGSGVERLLQLYSVIAEMERCGMVLCLHGQIPKEGIDARDREVFFLPDLADAASVFPKLKIVLEHVSTYEAVHTVLMLPDTVAATITVHHLLLTSNDIDDRKLRPHHFCVPRPNTERDRESLRWAAIKENSKFFLGTDSAPHLSAKKCCGEGAAGVFSAPVAIPLLAQIFEEMGALDKLADFTSKFGAQFYGLPVNEGHLTLVKESWQVPFAYPTESGEINPDPGAQLIPFWAGKTINWQSK
jgi:dihydroorotase